MQAIITGNQERIVELCKDHHVRRVSAFGSAVRDDFDPVRSDIDLLVDFALPPGVRYASNYFALRAALTALLGRSVDIVIEKSLTNPFLLCQVNAQKELLYAA